MSTNHHEAASALEPPGEADPLPDAGRAEVSHIGTTPAAEPPVEIGGRGGLEPTRFGDWEKGGRCIDF